MEDVNPNLTDAERALLQIYFLEKGIIPFELSVTNINCKGGGLTPEERRIANRKFRKLWRKILKNNLESVKDPSKDLYVARYVAKQGEQPTEIHKTCRKMLVLAEATKFVKKTIGRFNMK